MLEKGFGACAGRYREGPDMGLHFELSRVAIMEAGPGALVEITAEALEPAFGANGVAGLRLPQEVTEKDFCFRVLHQQIIPALEDVPLNPVQVSAAGWMISLEKKTSRRVDVDGREASKRLEPGAG
ncbi:MAG: hypothetical protein RJB38_266 [Pseudomonadota bacterium]